MSLFESATSDRTVGRVLVAEDDPELRHIIVESLQRDGQEVYDVSDGGALLLALARSARFHYDVVDVVVADVRMPLCTGLQALETVRAIRSKLPFVLLTAFGDRDVHQRAKQLGAVLLDKPISMDRLREIIRETIRGAAR
jgi:CheY-like chemotaxis protein